jgi:hypothetical protein
MGHVEATLEGRYPMIAWREPLHVATPTAQGYACRYCIAIFGLNAWDVPDLPQTPEGHAAHLAMQHPEPS